jgi:hypothetical protein
MSEDRTIAPGSPVIGSTGSSMLCDSGGLVKREELVCIVGHLSLAGWRTVLDGGAA